MKRISVTNSNGSLSIDKDIPPPKKGGKYGALPFERLEIGESFLVTNCHATSALSNQKLMATIKTGFTFSMSKGSDGVRIWRIA